MPARTTFKISDAVRDVLARSVITATSVRLPPGQLNRKLYEQVNKTLEGAGENIMFGGAASALPPGRDGPTQRPLALCPPRCCTPTN